MLLLLGCAQTGTPPGGPVDKTPPALVEVVPAPGAVNVPPGDRIILQFSERVVPPTTGRAFFVSPRPAHEPKIRWHGDRVEIILPDSFKTNQTYIITPSTAISDLRGNRFDSLGAIAFSTGPVIDTGRVAGAVYQADKAKGGLLAALFEAAQITDTTQYDSLYPTYLGQSNVSGEFAFAYLPDKTYQLIVYEDRNRNDLFDPASEPFALADRPIAVGGPLPLNHLRLNLTKEDTASAGVLTATFSTDRVLKVRLNRAIPLDLLRSDPSKALLIDPADTTRRIPSTALAQSNLDSSSALSLYFGPVPAGSYRLDITYSANLAPLVVDEVKVTDAEDKTAPMITSFTPGETPEFVRDVKIGMIFSEPLDTSAITPETFALWRDTLNTLPLEWSWRDAFHLDFSTDALKEGETYRLNVTDFDLKDRAGNVLGDSLTVYTFSTINIDSLGSVSGTVAIDLPDEKSDAVLLTLSAVGSSQQFTVTPRAGAFSIDLPAGKYVVSGFIDRDDNGRLSLGTIHPFRLAETQAVYPDTVAVRARFETAGIEFHFR